MIAQELLSNPGGSRLNLITRIYVWSVVLETLLFFILLGQSVAVVGANLSRILQFIVIISLILKFFFTPFLKTKIFNPFSPYFKWYFVYFLFLFISFIYGYFSGAYVGRTENFSSNVLRPGFEYFISIYYFLYFAVLPAFLLNSKKAIDYFFRIFFFMFFLSFFLGVIDYLLVVITGYEFIPRHLSDMRHVGKRFHGLAGEPRDAFVHLFFGLSFLFLREVWSGKKFNRLWIPIIFFAALLTQSSSGILGLIMALGLMFLFQIPRMSLSSIFVLFLSVIVISTGFGLMISNSLRIQSYIEAAPLAIEALERGLDLPQVIQFQISNIYPIWIRWIQFTEMNLLPLFLGTGLGTTSILNGYVIAEGGILNPHANIIRVFFESGLIGTVLFIIAFVAPLYRIEAFLKTRSIVFCMLLMLGISFGHRTSAVFTFLGIIIAIHIVLNKKDNNDDSIA